MITPSDNYLLPALFAALEHSSYPDAWEVDWSEEPLRYCFRGTGAAYPLSWVVPTQLGTLAKPAVSSQARIVRLGHLLAYAALPQESRLSVEPLATSGKVSPPSPNVTNEERVKIVAPSAFNLFRSVPSGGGLYPWEIYVLWRGPGEIPAGIYHYDAAHHQLCPLHQHDIGPDADVLFGLESGTNVTVAALIITVVHWKNYFKYGNASVHLHGLDAGLASAALEMLGPHFGFHVTFRSALDLEKAIRILGIDGERESVIAALPIEDVASMVRPRRQELISRQAHGKPGRPTPPCPAALLVEHQLRTAPPLLPSLPQSTTEPTTEMVLLPADGPVALSDLAEALRQRRSGIDPWRLQSISNTALGTLCRFAMAPSGVLLEFPALGNCLSLMLAAQAVTDLPPGYYRYESAHGGAVPLASARPDQIRIAMQEAYFLGNINFGAASLVASVTANLDRAFDLFGERAFRMLDLAAGQILGRLATMAQSMGLGSHIVYGFHSKQVLRQFHLAPVAHGLLLSIVVGRKPDHMATVPLPCWL